MASSARCHKGAGGGGEFPQQPPSVPCLLAVYYYSVGVMKNGALSAPLTDRSLGTPQIRVKSKMDALISWHSENLFGVVTLAVLQRDIRAGQGIRLAGVGATRCVQVF